ncbi:MAG: manganese efflux pump [Firmicutes bacterium]|nr:manganese efflux pump [Bacillota bacterium]
MITFVLNSILLGVGLAMDAFSVSIANGLNEPGMRRSREFLIAGTYAFFQFLMPVIGWFCVHELVRQFRVFEKFVPWIALLLLLWIGGKMLLDAIRGGEAADGPGEAEGSEATTGPGETAGPETAAVLTMGVLLLQGIATSIDALSVGFAIAGYSAAAAFVCALIIAAVTLLICMGGLTAGRKLSAKLAGKAGILGGCILIFIGIEIFVRGVFL